VIWGLHIISLTDSQYYHSIHAKGENVEDILRQAESDDNAKIEDGAPPRPLDGHASPSGDLEDGEVDELDDIGFSGEAADHCDKPGPVCRKSILSFKQSQYLGPANSFAAALFGSASARPTSHGKEDC